MENKLSAVSIKASLDMRAGVFPEELSCGALQEAGCLERVALLPKDLQERLSYLADFLVQATCDKPVNDELRAVVNQLCQALSYMMNSCSWREGELHDFDMIELQAKLERFAK